MGKEAAAVTSEMENLATRKSLHDPLELQAHIRKSFVSQSPPFCRFLPSTYLILGLPRCFLPASF